MVLVLVCVCFWDTKLVSKVAAKPSLVLPQFLYNWSLAHFKWVSWEKCIVQVVVVVVVLARAGWQLVFSISLVRIFSICQPAWLMDPRQQQQRLQSSIQVLDVPASQLSARMNNSWLFSKASNLSLSLSLALAPLKLIWLHTHPIASVVVVCASNWIGRKSGNWARGESTKRANGQVSPSGYKCKRQICAAAAAA